MGFSDVKSFQAPFLLLTNCLSIEQCTQHNLGIKE